MVAGLIPKRVHLSQRVSPLVIAHRGASGVKPENTLAAFKHAHAVGSDSVEVDVHLSADGHVVVIHDATVDRTAHGEHTGPVTELTLAQLQSLDAGSWKAAEFAAERIPTLEQAFQCTQGETMFLLENKQTGIESQIADVIKRTDTAQNIVYQSFSAQSVKAFRELMPHIPAAVLFGAPDIDDDAQRAATLVKTTLEANASTVSVHHSAVSADFVTYIQARGMAVFAWTVDSEEDMQRMIDCGVNGIITNYPQRLNELLGK